MRRLDFFSLFVFVSFLVSCKKEPNVYQISDGMKQYFVFQEGSYWIYQEDSTGELDSTYVRQFWHKDKDNSYSSVVRELVVLGFKSQFLSEFEVGYNCPGPNCLTIASHNTSPPNPSVYEIMGPLAYYAGWTPNTIITSPHCLLNLVYTYKVFPFDSSSNISYKDIIYSRVISIDSTEVNPYFYFREISFAKNIGIIKYTEKNRYYNLNRSWSLKRYKVVQ